MKQSKSSFFLVKKSPRILKFRRSKSDRTLNHLADVSADDEFERRIQPRRQSVGNLENVEIPKFQNSRHFYNHNYMKPILTSQKKASPLNKIGRKIKKKFGNLKKKKSTPLFNRKISNKSIEFWEEEIPVDEKPVKEKPVKE